LPQSVPVVIIRSLEFCPASFSLISRIAFLRDFSEDGNKRDSITSGEDFTGAANCVIRRLARRTFRGTLMSNKEISRRSFLRNTAAAVAGVAAIPATARAAETAAQGVAQQAAAAVKLPDHTVRGRKLNIACIGCGGKGSSDVFGVASENIVALCDVDFTRGWGPFMRFANAPRYKDYRKMLNDMGDQIDAVTVSTPDHTHFPAAMMAVEMGKHCFVQKPLTHTIWEARELANAAKRNNVATQMGNQGHAHNGTRLIYEWINSGMVGGVKEVHLWTNRPIWLQNCTLPKKGMKCPEKLDWNLWLGTGPVTPYHSGIHPFSWRGFWEFGCGALGDMGCHIMDAAFWSLHLAKRKLQYVVAEESDAADSRVTPNSSVITYQFDAYKDSNVEMPPLTMKWYDGGKMPPVPADLDTKLQDNGQLYIGEKANILGDTYAGTVRIVPEAKMKQIGKPPEMVERVKDDHYQEWIRACKGEGPPAGSNFIDHSGPLTEVVSLGNLAIRVGKGKQVDWDSETMTSPNCPEANQYVRHPFRLF